MRPCPRMSGIAPEPNTTLRTHHHGLDSGRPVIPTGLLFKLETLSWRGERRLRPLQNPWIARLGYARSRTGRPRRCGGTRVGRAARARCCRNGGSGLRVCDRRTREHWPPPSRGFRHWRGSRTARDVRSRGQGCGLRGAPQTRVIGGRCRRGRRGRRGRCRRGRSRDHDRTGRRACRSSGDDWHIDRAGSRRRCVAGNRRSTTGRGRCPGT